MQARLGTAWYGLVQLGTVRLCGGACCEAWQTECCERTAACDTFVLLGQRTAYASARKACCHQQS